MPHKPAAEVQITADLVRALVSTQAAPAIPDAATRAVGKAAEGWDSELWRLGDDLAVRLPRREVAAALVLHEQRVLPAMAPRLEAAGVRVPAPVVDGAPGCGFPWPWSVVPWFEGSSGLVVPRSGRGGWAERLAAGLAALHVEAPADHPVNPVRGVALAARATAVDERLGMLRASGAASGALLDRAARAWREGLEAPPWDRPPVWIHGDLHPGNLIAHGGDLIALIDFGDVTAGDPAYDLAIAWLAFDPAGRAAFRAATEDRYDHAAWVRARAWAAAVSVLLLTHSDDDPEYAALARETLGELAEGR